MVELSGNKTVGYKQSYKAVNGGKAKKAFIAIDAEEKLKQPFSACCTEKGVPYEMIPSMAELGKACGIEVGAAIAVLLKA